MRNIYIIGSGQIGSRHLQGLKTSTIPLNITVIDPTEGSLSIAKERYASVDGKNMHVVSFTDRIPQNKDSLDLAIISTSANVRKQILDTLLKTVRVKYIILEKLLFQKKKDYFSAEQLLRRNNTKAWVNCSMRTMPYYYNLKNVLNGTRIQYIVNGSQFGLITNAIHYIDHIAFLTGSLDFTVDTLLLNPEPILSKRKGFLELHGILRVIFSNGTVGTFCCYPDGSAPFIVEIFSQRFRSITRENIKKAWVENEKEGWVRKEIKADILLQSQMTGKVAEEILTTGNCTLTPYKESAKMHLTLLESLRKFLNNHTKGKYDYYPFT